MKLRNPRELLTHKRFDVVIKYLYAANQSSEFYKSMYKTHLYVWNNFCEGTPYKRGFEAFDKSFKSVINNFDETPPVPVNAEGHIPNGAHRLAAALYLNKDIKTRNTNDKENYTIIADHKLFLRKGLKKFCMQRAAIEYAKLKSNSYVVCLFPIGNLLVVNIL